MNPQDTTQITFTQVYNDFKGALSGAADALKTGSEHVYEILVRQQVVNSITYLIAIVLMLLTAIYLLNRARKEIKISRDNPTPNKWGEMSTDIEKTEVLVPMIAGLIIGTACFIVTAVNISAIVTGFINPEYGAIQEIREFIR